MLNSLFWRLAGLSLACSAVLLPLLLASRLICRRYSARTSYFLWLLLALRLILPLPIVQAQRAVTVEVPQYEVVLTPSAHTGSQITPITPQTETDASAPALDSSARTVSLTALLPRLWLAGVVICGVWLAVTYAVARRTLLGKSLPASCEDKALLDGLVEELGCKRHPALYRSDRVSTPMLVGAMRPVVLLPAGELPEEERSVILLHELTHLRRHDVTYKLFMRLVCILHWFNPLVWWMSREAARNLELCCDGDVVRGKDKTFRRTYGDILLKTAAGTGKSPALSARMGGGKRYLKVRLNHLFIQKKNSAALVCAALAAAILGGSLVSCTGEIPEEKPDNDWKAVVTSFGDPAEVQEQLEQWKVILDSFDDPADWIEEWQLEAARKQVEQKYMELKAELMKLLSVLTLEESIVVTRPGVVSFTIPSSYEGQDEWQIEIRGRAEYDGIGGMSLHYVFDRVDLEPGMDCSYDLSEGWSDITELYLSVTLGGQSKVIDLLAIVPSDTAKSGKEE